MLKIKRILHWLYVLIPAIFGFLMYNKVDSTIILFNSITLGRWIVLVMTIIYTLAVLWFGISRFSVCEDFSEAENEIGLKRYSVIESLHYTRAELLICLLGMGFFEMLRGAVPEWKTIARLYGDLVLLMYGMPFVISIFSIFSLHSKKYLEIFESDDIVKLKHFLWVSSVVCMAVSIINIFLSLKIANMNVCVFSYIVIIPALIFEIIYLHKSMKKIWPEEKKKEGIE